MLKRPITVRLLGDSAAAIQDFSDRIDSGGGGPIQKVARPLIGCTDTVTVAVCGDGIGPEHFINFVIDVTLVRIKVAKIFNTVSIRGFGLRKLITV